MKNATKLKVTQMKYVLYIVSFVLSIRIVIPLISWYIGKLEICFNKKYNLIKIDNFIECIKAIEHNKIIGLIYAVIALILIFCIFNVIFTRKQIKTEKEGIRFKTKDGTYGTSNFTEPKEIDILKIGNEEKTPGIVLGKTLDTGEIITLPDTCKEVNRNIMIWGASRFRKIDKLYYSKFTKNCRPRREKGTIRKISFRRKKCSIY